MLVTIGNSLADLNKLLNQLLFVVTMTECAQPNPYQIPVLKPLIPNGITSVPLLEEMGTITSLATM